MKYGLVGERLGHSYSKQIHERISDYTYDLCSIPPGELEHFVRYAKYSGINVTIPYKKTVIPFIDEISKEARSIGSVNTIVRRDGNLYGYNTDYDGFLYMAKCVDISFSNRKVLVLGTGGTSVTAQTAALNLGAREVIVVSRTGKVNYQNVYQCRDIEIIINTTPVGMYPDYDGHIIDLGKFKNLYGVLDVVYNPLRTNFVLDAVKLGLKASGGLPMLVRQAVVASELFTGRKNNEELSELIIKEMYRDLQNIVLIGMPGSGKTTVGRKLSERMNRSFFDTDECVVRQEGLTVPEIFAQCGESGFRMFEYNCVCELSKSTGLIIATGGGTVLDPENMRKLMHNGYICYLDRPIDKLPIDGRPLSVGNYSLEKLYNTRRPLYIQYGDACIYSIGTVEDAVNAVIENYHIRN